MSTNIINDKQASQSTNNTSNVSNTSQATKVSKNISIAAQLKEMIRKVYKKNKNLQKIIRIKRKSERKISQKLVKKKYHLKLEDCKLNNNFLYFKDRLYVSNDEILYTTIIRQMHESSFADHSEQSSILDLVSRHYYWLSMTISIRQYVKICYACRRIKIYREVKHDLLKSFSIFDQYWQNIFCDFIINLFVCERNERKFQHIIIVIDRLFKKKKFILINSLKVEVVIQTFIDFVWREEEYLIFIVSDRERQFIAHFWRRLCKRLNITSKISTIVYSKTDDQIENVNEVLKQYLRAYVNHLQNNWVNHLIIAKFEVNNHRSEFINIFSFLVIKRYLSRFDLKSATLYSEDTSSVARRDMSRADKIVEKLNTLRQYLRDELKWA